MADNNGNPSESTKRLILPNFANQWISHPDTAVDLCIMPLAKLINLAYEKNIEFFFKTFRTIDFPSEEEWESLHVIEEIMIIGYPIGLIDTLNHIPLIRTGTTSSPPFLDFNGKKEFVIDAGCFPGSSGSPVIYQPKGVIMSSKGKTPVRRFLLLGILYAGPEMKVDGEIVVKKIETTVKPLAESHIPINLGYVIKSNRINEFRTIIDK